MRRRGFLHALAATAGWTTLGPHLALAAAAAPARYDRLLVLVELKGGNDGLNTLVPYGDPEYYRLRTRLAIAREQVRQLDERVGLHPALESLLPLWRDKELAILQGVGYPDPNLSHFRSIEIWDTASNSAEYLHEGWLTRAFSAQPPPRSFAADGVVVGANDLGPLSGSGARAITLSSTEQFCRQAYLATDSGTARNKALEHILKVEADIAQAAAGLAGSFSFATSFPEGAFGNAVRTACQVVGNRSGVAALRLTLGGFDTHNNQAGTHARLLGELAGGLVALRSGLQELGRWNESLVLTYAEFGRRPQENKSAGTDHGTSSVHFAMGGRVRGGLYGEYPALDRLNGDGNLAHTLDFRGVYASVLDRWWGVTSREVLGARFEPVAFLRA
jgi:uncharacterized protein (DUF1501 family)